MSRRQEFTSNGSNPVKLRLEWKSNEKLFECYDKDSGSKSLLPMPLTFLVLKELSTVKGWHEPREGEGSGIFANEVKMIGQEEMTVRYSASKEGKKPAGEIAKGLYKDIKEKIKTAGGHYSRSIYAMTQEGDLINIQMKGTTVQEWGEFTEKCKSRLPDEWVSVTGSEARKKGSVNYTVPVFTFSGTLTEDEDAQAERVYTEIDSYHKGGIVIHEEADAIPVDDGDLPF